MTKERVPPEAAEQRDESSYTEHVEHTLVSDQKQGVTGTGKTVQPSRHAHQLVGAELCRPE